MYTLLEAFVLGGPNEIRCIPDFFSFEIILRV